MREDREPNGIIEVPDGGHAANLNEVLRGILETILQLPWLDTNAGGVFLSGPANRRLTLVATVNLPPSIKKTCAKVRYGHCLCGRVAASAELLHAARVDERHETHYEDMCDHGHYVVPIKLRNRLLGVMVLYIKTGHAYDAGEVHILENFAGIIALLIAGVQIHQEKRLADLILAHSSHGVVITDRKLKIQWVNRAFEKVSGYAVEEAVGMTPSILRSGRQGPDFYAAMWRSINERGFWEGEIWNRRKDGAIYPEWLNIVALKDDQNKVLRYAGMFIDLSPIKSAEEKIRRLAYYDSVTGLPNASLLHEKLEKMLSRSRSNDRRVVVLTLDLDYFHEINSGLGRRAGDAVLCEAARRISGVPRSAVKARMGADEFVIAYLERHGNDEKIPALAGGLAAAINERLHATFEFEQHELTLEGSIGIAWGSGRDADVESLLRRSAIALTHCKEHSRGGYQIHTREMERQADHRRFLGAAIGKAIERNELFLVYQPQADRRGRITGAEVLLRWRSKEYGDIPPDVFIGIAEERGVIIDIGRWVLESTLDQMARWREAGLYDSDYFPRLAVNVSPHQILSKNIIEEFARACATRGFRPESVELEITETGITRYSDHVIEHLHALSGMGFKIAIDDFGTGYSSLSRLRNFPVDVLKIDRSFVTNMATDASDATLVKSTIDMAHTLGFRVVAEGVEDAVQLSMLMEFGCDVFQGYYFSKPVCAEEFLEYASKRNSV
ncbi:cyclic di-GMP phosphodiesterase Gmr [bacterium BMS3Bbin12]|nr:cyclic di-GMP phosphodiesterase Gmr [bacterium BMS3Bbin12]GBE49565.1 cyclic di-GMP phosphodiesterase Gmr [bacterium BMS3Bbin13]